MFLRTLEFIENGCRKGRTFITGGILIKFTRAREIVRFKRKKKKNALVVCTLRHGFMNIGLYG
jgi:hypothetical protein